MATNEEQEQGPRCRVTIDTYRCNGCGACAACAPELFRLADDETARGPEGPVACSAALDEAAAWCPRECIEIVREA